jgi:hypothetical protein
VRHVNVAAAEELRARLIEAYREIRRFRAIPADAPTECRGADDERALPPYLQEQVIDVRAR